MAERLIEAFKGGNLAAPLANVYMSRKDFGEALPMYGWSVRNQVYCLLGGCEDARGFQQWKKVGRQVTKGEKAAAYIMFPFTRTFETPNKEGEGLEDEPMRILYKWTPVFDAAQTEGDELPPVPARDFVAALPLLDVATAWKLPVAAGRGEAGAASGSYYHNGSGEGVKIILRVKNLSTWLHELMHAADNKLGNLVERGQKWRSETVAEFGGCVLANLIGEPEAADMGGCWQYVSAYADAAGIEPLTAINDVLDRTLAAIDLIMATAETA